MNLGSIILVPSNTWFHESWFSHPEILNGIGAKIGSEHESKGSVLRLMQEEEYQFES